ncbi:rod shape-determining protein MreD [Gilvimarinus polysaccharolyticus]|uniref:rod shape-determining protein MreD n=1 Tax=Gilvimarinus polysaccharolyticus TaxID=863921 RepID=UPI000673A831|nr:rod shape-determining protein MreD [Gilvimarinus polysaccharolyticus]
MWLDRLPALVLIVLTLFVAILLDVYPLALEHRIFRPQFVLLVVIYWVYVLPQSCSMAALIILGVLLDVTVGSPLGQHPLVLVVTSYLCLRSYRRVRHFTHWQESLWILLLVACAQLIAYWVQSLSGRQMEGFGFLLPSVASACCWPVIAILFDRLRRLYRISRQV